MTSYLFCIYFILLLNARPNILISRSWIFNLINCIEMYWDIYISLVKAMVFPVVMYGCDSWTVKKAKCWRIDAFELWCWRRLLRVPWTARRSNQSILKDISPKYSLKGLMLKLKLQYFGHLMRRTDSLEKSMMLGKVEGRRRERQDEIVGWHHQLDGHEFEHAPGVGDGQGCLECCSPWSHKESDMTEWLNWTELRHLISSFKFP